ncbi:tRNA synthetases class II-domain-containing protein [Amylocarpus encephaloides]|uniref:tRNA synthetases class II-domain-containing protein n=1 Tax=Amylocarpus encephaloides TaxID=45428 RepID=A0A9P8C277_9HELO|nr:tRNA synthetases class II-domain-containing protein [Amylocarpus encephaloides]
MIVNSCASRSWIRFHSRIVRHQSPLHIPSASALSQHKGRPFHTQSPRPVERNATQIDAAEFWKEYKGAYNVPMADFPFVPHVSLELMNKRTTAAGTLCKVSRLSKSGLAFAHINPSPGESTSSVQILCGSAKLVEKLDSIPLYSAISVTGLLKHKHKPKKTSATLVTTAKSAHCGEGYVSIGEVEIAAEDITCLNNFDKRIPNAPDHVYPPSNRHLQIRFDSKLRNALLFRAEVTRFAREELKEFHEIETPILFKSTPEGAREFLVPTRKIGFAYALPQSPQQYKQILMASGITRYVQFARCFRDEDLRADRQPEFTQIDLEMAWTDGEGVMQRIETFVKSLYKRFEQDTQIPPLSDAPFHRMRYEEAMSQHGSDKPDLRIPGLIHRIDHIVPPQLRSMITSLDNPIVEAYKIHLNGDAEIIQKFLRQFFASPEGEMFEKNPDGGPGINIFDPRKPLNGLQTFGFEGAAAIESFYHELARTSFQTKEAHPIETSFDEGDLVFLQARQNLPHSGGSTALGNLRRAIYKAAIAEGILEADPSHWFLWVNGFPMFTASNGTDPGQEGTAGFSATHHPFTAPMTAEDVDLLLPDPLKAKADHYDLVVNGVELGGGSRRIHSAEMQKFIMRDVLKMSETRINDFSHLLKALSAGCPPHAGFAIGFDRLIAVMCGTDSVRDVIAFPKNSKGDDLMVMSPRRVNEEELARYGLEVIPSKTPAI